MDDFTSRSLEYSNTTLYDAGYINVVTDYDYEPKGSGLYFCTLTLIV